MSRILKALQQIEARAPQPRQRPESGPPQEDDLTPPPPADEAVGNEAAVEAALARAEDAAAMAAGEFVEETLPGAKVAAPSEPRAYGKLADKILAQLPPDQGASLMFTSPCQGDGKTEMLVSLAAALVERIAEDVLVVDANLCVPALARHLGVEAPRGLADVLQGTANWQEVVRDTAVNGLRVLPGVSFPTPDGRPPDCSNLEPLLEELCGKWRLVLIDTASLVYPEAAPIAGWCTGTYLIVRLNHTIRRAVEEAVGVIEDCGGRVLGGVVLGGQRGLVG